MTGIPSSARSRTSGTSFWVDVPGQVGDGASHYFRFLLEQSDPFLRFAQLCGFVLGHSRPVAVFDVGLLSQLCRVGSSDPEVFRDLGQWGFALTGDRDHIATEFLGERLRHDVHPFTVKRVIFTGQMSTKPGAVPTVFNGRSSLMRHS